MRPPVLRIHADEMIADSFAGGGGASLGIEMAQGFPDTYVIDRAPDGGTLTKTAQIRLVGNSVAPPIAAAIIASNLAGEEVIAA